MKQISAESFLNLIGLNPNESILSHFNKIVESTPGFREINSHIIALNDKIKHYGACITLSSNKDYLKIKNASSSDVINEIENWATKYKISLIRGSNNNYYIAGKE
ncbi:MAG: hypothetical protein DSZ06_00420 [Sulfurospirillum sp.]|nr:MAG: hypothetical protein DSZ06_00420 [Sulfurospirillum sp.]